MKKKDVQKMLKNIRLVFFDFDGVFTDNRVIVSEEGKESVVCNRSDGLGLALLRRIGTDALILSTEINPVVSFRAKKLKLPCYHGLDDKLKKMEELAVKRKVPLKKTAYVGNDINDLQCLRVVGLPVAVADAYPEVKKNCKIILKKNGGYGAVREFCKMLYSAKVKK